MTFLELAPYVLLVLSGIGFILTLITDHFHIEHRVKIGLLMVILAACSVLAMK